MAAKTGLMPTGQIASQAGDAACRRGGYLAGNRDRPGASVSLIFAAARVCSTVRIFCDLGGVDRVLLFTMQGEPKSVLQGLLTVFQEKAWNCGKHV
jgi:hypothetical protein